MDTDDKTILRRLKRGDAAALEAAVRQYSGYVTAVIGNQLGPCAAAEDIEELASDVFVALWRAPQPTFARAAVAEDGITERRCAD